jgi:hypothetical protein
MYKLLLIGHVKTNEFHQNKHRPDPPSSISCCPDPLPGIETVLILCPESRTVRYQLLSRSSSRNQEPSWSSVRYQLLSWTSAWYQELYLFSVRNRTQYHVIFILKVPHLNSLSHIFLHTTIFTSTPHFTTHKTPTSLIVSLSISLATIYTCTPYFLPHETYYFTLKTEKTRCPESWKTSKKWKRVHPRGPICSAPLESQILRVLVWWKYCIYGANTP